MGVVSSVGTLPLNCALSSKRLCVDNLIDLFSLARTPPHYLLSMAFEEVLLFNLLDSSVSKPYCSLMLNFHAFFLTKLRHPAVFFSLCFTLLHCGSGLL